MQNNCLVVFYCQGQKDCSFYRSIDDTEVCYHYAAGFCVCLDAISEKIEELKSLHNKAYPDVVV